jgi:ribosomal protein L40E
MVVFAPMWIFIVVAAIFIVLVATSNSRRRAGLDHAQYDVKVCPQCGANLPTHAAFCAECGHRLEAQ